MRNATDNVLPDTDLHILAQRRAEALEAMWRADARYKATKDYDDYADSISAAALFDALDDQLNKANEAAWNALPLYVSRREREA